MVYIINIVGGDDAFFEKGVTILRVPFSKIKYQIKHKTRFKKTPIHNIMSVILVCCLISDRSLVHSLMSDVCPSLFDLAIRVGYCS